MFAPPCRVIVPPTLSWRSDRQKGNALRAKVGAVGAAILSL